MTDYHNEHLRKDQLDNKMGFLVVLKVTPIVSVDDVGQKLTDALDDMLGVDEVDVDYLGEIECYEEAEHRFIGPKDGEKE